MIGGSKSGGLSGLASMVCFFSLYLLYHLTLVINEAELSFLFDTRPPSSLAKLPHKSSGRE